MGKSIDSVSGALTPVQKSQVWNVATVDLHTHIHSPRSVSAQFTSGEEMHAEHLKYTILDAEQVVFRDVHELAELAIATKGKINPSTGLPFQPIDLTSFRPERIALHQAIATVITSVQYQPKTPEEAAALEHDEIFLRIARQVMVDMKEDVDLAAASLMKSRADIEVCVTALIAQLEAIEKIDDVTKRFRANMKVFQDGDLQKEIRSWKEKINDSAELGAHVPDYTKTKALIALVTDAVYKKTATGVMEQVAQKHVQKLVDAGEIQALVPPEASERKLFLIAGGPASGKGSSYAILRYNAEKAGLPWANVSKGGGGYL